jgi:hypothetical protein
VVPLVCLKRYISPSVYNFDTTNRTGHDIPPKRNRPVPPNSTNHTDHLHQSPRRAPPLPHHWPSTLPQPAHLAERGSLHAPRLHHERHARRYRRVPNLRTPPRPPNPHPHGPRPTRRQIRPAPPHALQLRRCPRQPSDLAALAAEVPADGLQARLRHD